MAFFYSVPGVKSSPLGPVEILDLRLLAFKTVFCIAITSISGLGARHTFVVSSQVSRMFFSGRMCILYSRVLGKELSRIHTPFGVETRHMQGIMRALCVCCTLSA